MKKIIKSISLLSAIILLTGCEESYAGFTLPNGQDIINKLIPNIPAFLVQLTAFILMAVVVIKFAPKQEWNFSQNSVALFSSSSFFPSFLKYALFGFCNKYFIAFVVAPYTSNSEITS